MKEFNSFGAFAAHLAAVTVETGIAEHECLEQAARIIEKSAKEKIGQYQSEAGPFAAWAELADSTKADRVQQGYSENDPGYRSGEMRESIEHVVVGREAHIGSNDDHLVWFEFGTDKQPPRSVLGGAAFESAPAIVELVGMEMYSVLSGNGVKKVVR